MRKISHLIIVLIFGFTKSFAQNISDEEKKQIQEQTISFDKPIDSVSIADFKKLKINNEIKVFGLGEANHGTREFQLLKWKLAEYLISENGLNTIMIEFPYSHGLLLSDYVKGKNNSGLKILTDQKNSEYKNEEFVDFINEIKKINENKSEEQKIDFLGGDIFGKPTAIKILKDYFQRVDSSRLSIFNKYQELEKKTYLSVFQQDEKIFTELSKKTNRILKRNKEHYINKSSSVEYNKALNLSEALGIKWKGNSRAKTFANNITKILSENSKNKILVIAHNQHIGKLHEEVGSLLKKKLGEKYLAIGTDYEEGEFSLWNLKDSNKRFVDTLYTPKLEIGFANKFSSLSGKFHYVSLTDFPVWTKQENYIANIGMGFNKELSPIEYRQKVILTDYFDAIFIFKKIHPIKRVK